MIVASRVTVDTDPTPLWDAADADYSSCLILAVDGNVDVGADDVASGEGFPLVAGAAIPADFPPNEVPYAVAASGTVEVAILRLGVG